MSRGLWKGNISFGLVAIPISVVSGEKKTSKLDFDLLDRRDHAHVGYQKINKNTGKVIDSDQIVKGLKLESGKFAIFEQEELKDLRVKGTNSIDIQQFVERSEVDPIYFKKFYYLEALKGSQKTYVLLREALKTSGKFGLGLIVLHNRQQLVLIGASNNALVMHSIYYRDEIKDEKDLELSGLKTAKLNPRELSTAEKLVKELSAPWKPEKFKDSYLQEVQSAIKRKGRKKVSVEEESGEIFSGEKTSSKVLDLLPLLEKSLKSRNKPLHRSSPKNRNSRTARRIN